MSSKPDCAKLDHSELDHADPNQGLHHKSSREIWTLVGYSAA